MSEDIVGKFYYPQVVGDIEKVFDAIEYYKHVHKHGEQHTKLKGVIERLMMEQPGLLRIYEDAHTDASMVSKWLEEQIKHKKAKKRIWFLKDPQAKIEFGELKKTEADAFVQADDEIQYHVTLQMLVELWAKSLEKLVGRLNRRGMYLTMVSKLRIAGEREAYIDASHETNPEFIG